MQLEIGLEKQIKEIDKFLTDVKFKALRKATKRALNRTATQVRTFSIKKIREERPLKATDVRKRIQIFRARGNNIANMDAVLAYSGIPLPLILFVTGQKTPRTVTSRSRPLNIAIKKGSKKAKKGLYIAKAKHGKQRYQVFRRVDKKQRSAGMVKQSAPSIAQLLQKKRSIRNLLDSRASLLLQKNFTKEFAFELNKLK